MNMYLLFLAEGAIALAAGVFLARHHRKWHFWNAFRKDFKVPSSFRDRVQVFPGSKAAVNGFTLRGNECILHVGSWVVTAKDPEPIYELVTCLREQGADISHCMEEQFKYNMDLFKHQGEEGYEPEFALTKKDLEQIRAANQRSNNQ